MLEAVKLGADDFIVKPYKTGELAERIKDLTYEIDEAGLREILLGLHQQDPKLHEIPALQNGSGVDSDLYPMSSADKKMCLALPRGLSPFILSKLPYQVLVENLTIYRKCAGGWRKVWPRSGKMIPPVPSAS